MSTRPARSKGRTTAGSSNRDKPREEQTLHVLVRFEGGKVSEIRGLSADCQLDAGGRRFVWLGAVKPEESVAYLAGLAQGRQGGRGELRRTKPLDPCPAPQPSADAALEDLASSTLSPEEREQALFWMGQTRGERGARFLAGVLRTTATTRSARRPSFP